jgi:hypothetical protein
MAPASVEPNLVPSCYSCFHPARPENAKLRVDIAKCQSPRPSAPKSFQATGFSAITLSRPPTAVKRLVALGVSLVVCPDQK